jgi:hypothetical protein
VILEARARIELANKGFADLEKRRLTTLFTTKILETCAV